MLTDQQAAVLGKLLQDAYDMYEADRSDLSPPASPGLALDWEIIGHLTAADSLFRSKQTMVAGSLTWYGFLARSTAVPGTYLAVIRGTEGIVEWIKNSQFLMRAHPVAGRVERGFQDIYESLQLAPVNGVSMPAWVGLPIAVGDTGTLIVVGHSLGSALGSLLIFDLVANMGDRVSACLFASPRPGDATFAKALDQRVKDYRLFNYELDIVPRVPRGFDYTDLPRVSWIGISDAQAHIRFDFLCHHHISSYRAMLDFDSDDWSGCDCILGPTNAAAAGGLAL